MTYPKAWIERKFMRGEQARELSPLAVRELTESEEKRLQTDTEMITFTGAMEESKRVQNLLTRSYIDSMRTKRQPSAFQPNKKIRVPSFAKDL